MLRLLVCQCLDCFFETATLVRLIPVLVLGCTIVRAFPGRSVLARRFRLAGDDVKRFTGLNRFFGGVLGRFRRFLALYSDALWY